MCKKTGQSISEVKKQCEKMRIKKTRKNSWKQRVTGNTGRILTSYMIYTVSKKLKDFKQKRFLKKKKN